MGSWCYTKATGRLLIHCIVAWKSDDVPFSRPPGKALGKANHEIICWGSSKFWAGRSCWVASSLWGIFAISSVLLHRDTFGCQKSIHTWKIFVCISLCINCRRDDFLFYVPQKALLYVGSLHTPNVPVCILLVLKKLNHSCYENIHFNVWCHVGYRTNAIRLISRKIT